MAEKLKAANLGAMFGIEMAPDADAPAPEHPKQALCVKCNGRGNFLSYKGRVVGQCFKCDGTGLADPNLGRPLQDGDCPKCYGSGEWRPGLSCFACEGSGKLIKAAVADIDVSAIATAFAAAFANGIKTPRLRLGEFLFSRAPDHGKNAGSIYVKRKVNAEYLGKVADGKFQASRACDDPTREAVIAVAADPDTAAKAYGQRTGKCSCCGLTLTNKVSIELGIGPICRGKFGWS